MERPTLQRIEEFVRQGESEHLEFKRRFTSDSDIARTLVAFANADGGILLIGVEETATGARVVGLSPSELVWTSDRLTNLTSRLLPTLIPIGNVEIDGKPVVYASVNPLPPHLRPATTATGDAYERREDRNVRVEQYPVSLHPADSGERCRVFVAMSFREEEEPALVDYHRAMQRAAARVDDDRLELLRMDEVEGDYEISAQISEQIDGCDAILADFTLSPHNVYFELGYARGRDKQVIQTARQGTKLEFDVRNWRTVFYRNATELEERLLPEFARLLAREA